MTDVCEMKQVFSRRQTIAVKEKRGVKQGILAAAMQGTLCVGGKVTELWTDGHASCMHTDPDLESGLLPVV